MSDLMTISWLANYSSGYSNWSYNRDGEEYTSVSATHDGEVQILIERVESQVAHLIVSVMNALPDVLPIAASTFNRTTCEKCGELAVWEYAPSDGVHEYCDACVPRGCSCNVIDWEDENPDTPQQRDEQGRELPCIEYEYWGYGFPPATPEDRQKILDRREETRRQMRLTPAKDTSRG